MSNFTQSDYYVLLAAVDQAWRGGKSRTRVRTTTLLDIGAQDLVTPGDRMAYDAFQEDMKDLHAVDVDVLQLKEILDGMDPPSNEALSSQPFLESVPPEGRVRNFPGDPALDDWYGEERLKELEARGVGPDGRFLVMGEGERARRAEARGAARATQTPPLDQLPRDAIPPEGRRNSVDPRTPDPSAPRQPEQALPNQAPGQYLGHVEANRAADPGKFNQNPSDQGRLINGQQDQVIQGVEEAPAELSDPQRHYVEAERLADPRPVDPNRNP